MNDKKKKILNLMALALLVFSCLFKFLQYNDYKEVYLYTKHIKGIFVLIFIMTANTLFCISKKPKLYYCLSILGTFCYVYVVLEVLKFKLATSTLQIGFYLYILSFIIATINLFVSFDKDKTKIKKIKEIKEKSEISQIEGTYLYGLKKHSELYKKGFVIQKSEKGLKLDIDNGKIIQDITLNSFEKIEIKVVLKPIVEANIQNKKYVEKSGKLKKVKIKSKNYFHEVKITYKYRNKLTEMVIVLDENPTELFEEWGIKKSIIETK